MTEHWVLVTASREWRDRQHMRTTFLAIQQRLGAPAEVMGIVHGAARGGDRMADEVAAELGWARDPVPCTRQDWERYGRSASHRRNARMIHRRAYVGCVAFPLGLSAGTRGCMVAAEDAGIRAWNRGEEPLADGLYRVTERTLCAGFEVRRSVVVACAPILRGGLASWWRLAMDPTSNVDEQCGRPVGGGVMTTECLFPAADVPTGRTRAHRILTAIEPTVPLPAVVGRDLDPARSPSLLLRRCYGGSLPASAG